MISNLIFLMLFVTSVQAKTAAPNFAAGEEGCLAYSVLGSKANLVTYGQNCKVRTPPCSTFKITIAELAFKNKKLNKKGEHFKWDGIKRNREALNKDQDLLSWMKDSVVWVSSVLVNRLGRGIVEAELKELKYGNASIGPEEFWIQGPLGISVDEQAIYLNRQNDPNLQEAIELLPIEKVGVYSVSGKTGSCFQGEEAQGSQIGWYVGIAKSPHKEYAFALRFLKQKNSKLDGPAGFRAKELFLEWFRHLQKSEQ